MASKKTAQAFAPDADLGAILGYITTYQTIEDVAKRLGVSRTTVWRYQQGKLKPRQAKLAQLLRIAGEVAQVHGNIPAPVVAEFEKAGVVVKDRVPDVLYV